MKNKYCVTKKQLEEIKSNAKEILKSIDSGYAKEIFDVTNAWSCLVRDKMAHKSGNPLLYAIYLAFTQSSFGNLKQVRNFVDTFLSALEEPMLRRVR